MPNAHALSGSEGVTCFHSRELLLSRKDGDTTQDIKLLVSLRIYTRTLYREGLCRQFK